jgi:hypothetical protein
MSREFRLVSRVLLLFITAGMVGACDSCRSERPYTPFGVTSALPATPSASAIASTSASVAVPGAAAATKKALFAGAAARRWSLEGRELEAPDGRLFEQALGADFNGDGAREIVAWTLPDPERKEPSAPGELWFYPASSPAKKLLDFPGFLPTGGNCTPLVALSQAASTTKSVTVDVRVACTSQLVGRTATRAVALIDPFADRQPRFGLRAADAAPGEVLALDLTARDEDNDGRDDYHLVASLTRGSAPAELSASMVFLDRAAGISRDAREPARGLLELLKRDTSRALKKKTAELARAHVDIARRLLASLCAEGATPRVFDWSGAPLPCSGLADLSDRLSAIEISASLAEGDVPAALGALGRDGWYFAPMRAALRSQLVKDIEKQAKVVPATRTSLGARPKTSKPPSFSALRFESGGALAIVTESGLYRLAPDAVREEPVGADGAPASWPLEVVTPRGDHWIGVGYSCGRSEVELLLAGGSNEPQVTTLLAPRPGVCGGAHFDDNFTPAPLAAEPQLEALVGGAFVGTRSAAVPPGSSRSANGAYVAIPSPLGLFIQSASGAGELWRIDGFSSASTSGCVVDDSGQRAACVRAGRAELYTKSPAPAP